MCGAWLRTMLLAVVGPLQTLLIRTGTLMHGTWRAWPRDHRGGTYTNGGGPVGGTITPPPGGSDQALSASKTQRV